MRNDLRLLKLHDMSYLQSVMNKECEIFHVLMAVMQIIPMHDAGVLYHFTRFFVTINVKKTNMEAEIFKILRISPGLRF